LIALLNSQVPQVRSAACDYTGTLMSIADQKVEVSDLNSEPLPYGSNEFDLVTCTEVIEHLENFRRLVRECYRVTKPGGLVIFTTPNILSIESRWRYLSFGFATLFGPLPVGRTESYTTAGHISPISYFYLAHSLAESGFSEIELEIDKVQRSGIPKLLLLWPLIAVFGLWFRFREVRRYRTVDATNRHIVNKTNSIKMLLGRTLVVSTRKSGRG
jgi:SAM-dependent methyltransferase